ncbi:uncharacterized protein LTR77_001951 [Saxophila tyrrhenica]|uniref:Uncharacterized protein n=1 Tax=Saxophila tyrrhenica TaxID=1690608 RepID=A0AAV9PHT9_9PEZI|nr:hypothetical protein LTR77_001951 [Saxophila tyrrhenica]
MLDVTCGLWATAVQADAKQAIEEATGNIGAVAAIVGASPGLVFVGSQACSRLACVGTSGFYACNDRDEGIFVSPADLTDSATALVDHCVAYYKDKGVDTNDQTPVSAQAFYLTGPEVNLVVSYCDSNEDQNKKPSDYTFDENCGPNGCNPTCGWDGAQENPCRFWQNPFASAKPTTSTAAVTPTPTL